MARIQKPEFEILHEEGEVSHEEAIRTAALIINEMLGWDYSEPLESVGA